MLFYRILIHDRFIVGCVYIKLSQRCIPSTSSQKLDTLQIKMWVFELILNMEQFPVYVIVSL